MGATVVSSFGAMYMGGQLTGNGPADRQLRQQWINAGWKPNHFYIGDVGFDYRSLEPYNVIFLLLLILAITWNLWVLNGQRRGYKLLHLWLVEVYKVKHICLV